MEITTTHPYFSSIHTKTIQVNFLLNTILHFRTPQDVGTYQNLTCSATNLPCNQLDKVGIKHDTGACIKGTADGCCQEVSGHQLLLSVGQDSLH